MATTNQGELVEIDLNTGTTRWIGDAGHTGGLDHGWNGLSFDAEGTLFVTSRHRAEPPTDGCSGAFGTGGCNHLYTVDTETGRIVRHIGNTGVAFMADIDFAPSGTLFASLFFNDALTENGGLASVDLGNATATKIGLFGPNANGRGLEQGGLSIHPRTAAIWGIESSFAADPHIFAVDPASGAIHGQPVSLRRSDGGPLGFGFDALEILPDGRLIALASRAGIKFEIYSVDPNTGLVSLIFVEVDSKMVGKANGLEHIPASAFPFASFDIERADFALDPQGRVGRDKFELDGTVALNEASDGIDLLQDPVILRVGAFSQTLLPGEFVRNATDDGFTFEGMSSGITRFALGDDGRFAIEADGLGLADLDAGPALVELEIGNDFGGAEVSFDRIGSAPVQRSMVLLATTNQGELVEIDLNAGTTTLLGNAGGFENRSPQWTGLSFDAYGRLLTTSRFRSEVPGQGCDGWFNTDGGKCAHLYELDRTTGSIVRDIGNTGFAFLSDIDLAADGTLLGSVFINEQASGDGGLLTLDTHSGAGTLVSRYGPADLDRNLENGALAVHPLTGDVWAIESSNAANTGTPSIFRVDPATGLALGPAVALQAGGVPAAFGFDGLEILPNGRFVATRAGGISELYTIDPAGGRATLMPLASSGSLTGHLNGLTFADPTIPFDQFKVTLAWVRISDRYSSNRDRVFVWGRFRAPDGIDPVNEDVTIGFGSEHGFYLTIPAGSFERKGRRKGHFWRWFRGRWEYRAPHGTSGIRRMQIWDDGRFTLSAERLDLSGVDLREPVDFSIWLGNNTGGFAIPFNHKGFFFNRH
ncbi:MAG: hypothetical protein O7I93_09290 [Gemmatimonadetes bacterium]|nr:hypothetical protein [Gemmatimonadota bacterium]